MSDIMLQGVLRMPPELWHNNPLDIAQRRSRYVQAADRIDELERENATLREDKARLDWLFHKDSPALIEVINTSDVITDRRGCDHYRKLHAIG